VELEAQGRDVRVRVSGTVVEIAPEGGFAFFERLYRADKARSREDGGFGFGLSFVKWINESHNGGVDLTSRPESGSTSPLPCRGERLLRWGVRHNSGKRWRADHGRQE